MVHPRAASSLLMVPILGALLTVGCAAAGDDTGAKGGTASGDSADSGDTSGDTGETADTSDTGDLPTATTTWYIGTSNGQTPDGSYVAPTDEILFIRALDSAASTVTEDAWTVPTRGAVTHYSLVHEVDVTTETFSSTFVTDDGTLNVTGGYDEGADWAWTAWHSTSIYQDGTYAGTRVESVDHVLDGGVAHADKTVYDADDVEIYVIVEESTPCSEANFDAELNAAGG